MSFIKYPGGKQSELPIIRQYMPTNIVHYYEPFVGGGAVYFDTQTKGAMINDKSSELIYLYNAVKEQNIFFFQTLHAMDIAWESIKAAISNNQTFLQDLYIKYRKDIITEQEFHFCLNGWLESIGVNAYDDISNALKFQHNKPYSFICEYTYKKCQAMKKLEFTKKPLSTKDIIANIESGMKAGLYMYIRALYNVVRLHENLLKTEYCAHAYDGMLAALYVFIREMAYSAMFRFNANGEFNVPYGGISYNNKHIADIIQKYQDKTLIEKLNTTVIENLDFMDFMRKHQPAADDFVFVDPPYDSEFSEYDNSSFGKKEHQELAEYLINECNGNFMIVIKNTDFIASLYQEGTICRNGNPLSVIKFDKKYMVSFMNRNDKAVTHLLIKNY